MLFFKDVMISLMVERMVITRPLVWWTHPKYLRWRTDFSRRQHHLTEYSDYWYLFSQRKIFDIVHIRFIAATEWCFDPLDMAADHVWTRSSDWRAAGWILRVVRGLVMKGVRRDVVTCSIPGLTDWLIVLPSWWPVINPLAHSPPQNCLYSVRWFSWKDELVRPGLKQYFISPHI